MRSRYTAYALRNAAYLQETWDATKRPEKIDFSRENIAWLKLEITDTKKGQGKRIKNYQQTTPCHESRHPKRPFCVFLQGLVLKALFGTDSKRDVGYSS